ncbi:hypothetical protein JGI8_01046 [Candidatus Kryptonium thompsonii]|nr:hypothetical protein JGI8_01046 [Candidatus Kryptonium thompsoni]
MIYVTHDQVEAMTMGDRIVVMKDGIIQQIDTPLNLYNFPKNKFVAGFIGSPSMNFLEGKIVHEDGLKFIENNNGLRLSIPQEYHDKLKNYVGKDVILGIRPEHIYDPIYTQVPSGERVNVFVDVVEPMGNEVYLYFATATAQCVARIPAHEEPQTGIYKELVIDVRKAHFFDKDTEESILYR